MLDLGCAVRCYEKILPHRCACAIPGLLGFAILNVVEEIPGAKDFLDSEPVTGSHNCARSPDLVCSCTLADRSTALGGRRCDQGVKMNEAMTIWRCF